MAFLYLSLASEKKLARYRIDDAGDLALLGHTEVPGEPSVQSTDPGRRILYAAMRSTGQLLSFSIAPDSGALGHLHTLDTGLEDPAYLRTDHSGKFLLTSYYVSGRVTVYPIGPDGAAREPLASVVETGIHAHGLAFDPSNRFVFVPHTCPSNGIWQFVWAEGHLQPNTPVKLGFDLPLGPRHIHFHPQGRFVYAVNEQGNSVTAFRFAAQEGTLAPLQTLSTLPADFSGGACARMEIHPSGRFLYAANRGHDSLAAFAIDPAGGQLTAIGHFSTPANPRSFAIDPSGRFLFVAGESADRLVAFVIDPEKGHLEPRQTYQTGSVPWWVEIVEPGTA